MLTIKHLFASTAVVATLAVGIAAAQMPSLSGSQTAPGDIQVQLVTNGQDGFQIGVPLGWEFASSDQPDYVMADPAGKAFCAVNSVPEPGLNVSNDQLRQALSQPLGEEFWTNNVFSELVNRKYISSGADANHPGGWPVQTVVVQSDESNGAQTLAVTRAAIATLKSQQSYLVLCLSESKDFEAQKPYFNAVFQSFKVTKP